MNRADLDAIAKRNIDLIERKMADYGTANLELTGVPGVAVRLQDKISRLLNLTRAGTAPNFESIEDTAADVVNYGLLAQAMLAGKITSRPSTVYLAGPIRSVGMDRAIGWRQLASNHLNKFGITCYDPAQSFHRPKQIDRQTAARMESINRQAIAVSDVVLAMIFPDSLNIGTIRELEAGSALGKRCLLVCQADVEGKVSVHDLEVHQFLPEALQSITGADPEEITLSFEIYLDPLEERHGNGVVHSESDGATTTEPRGIRHQVARKQSPAR